MFRFMRFVYAATGQDFHRYDELHRWSVTELEAFWSVLADYADVRFSRPADHVLDNPGSMPGARWFPGAELNFAERLLSGPDEQIVLVGLDERGARRQFSRSELRSLTASLAAELRIMGVGQGDRVAAVLPNCPEAVIALLASASIGIARVDNDDAKTLERCFLPIHGNGRGVHKIRRIDACRHGIRVANDQHHQLRRPPANKPIDRSRHDAHHRDADRDQQDASTQK